MKHELEYVKVGGIKPNFRYSGKCSCGWKGDSYAGPKSAVKAGWNEHVRDASPKSEGISRTSFREFLTALNEASHCDGIKDPVIRKACKNLNKKSFRGRMYGVGLGASNHSGSSDACSGGSGGEGAGGGGADGGGGM